jgi:diaminohydroxyphosphoribosylaminopyrimidine deaminase / 5-amino-6-(5-phosphoribosylamino)uracil reductase
MAVWVREELMRRAIELSRGGFPAPNPHVGCVLERDGQIAGEGFHQFAGGSHAEVVALQNAGEAARGATAYVTLEPCNHQGLTPPCSLALIEAGVARVAIACADPNPKAAGGAAVLRDAGIEVVEGVLEDEAAKVNRQFLTAMRLSRPFVVAKAAISLDGRIALPSGESKWITGDEARQEAHRLRAQCGCVLVGRGTVEADNPLLTARLEGVVNQPLRVVLDPQGSLRGDENVFTGEGESVHIVRRAQRPNQIELEVEGGLFSPQDILAALRAKKQTGVLIEGGSKTIAGFLDAGLVDRLELFVAPRLLGAGPSWFESRGVQMLADSPWFEILESRMVGRDLWITAVPTATPGP